MHKVKEEYIIVMFAITAVFLNQPNRYKCGTTVRKVRRFGFNDNIRKEVLYKTLTRNRQSIYDISDYNPTVYHGNYLWQ